MKKRKTPMKKRGFFSYNYSLCKKYYLESKFHVKLACAIFALTFLFGLIFPVLFRDEIRVFIEQMINSLDGLSLLQLIAYIFFNNLKASFFAMITGIGIGILPVFTAVINGYLLGFVSRAAIESQGILILWRLLPHGIFELPAILLSVGIGLKIGSDVLKKKPARSLKENIVEAIRFFCFVVFPLLLAAAFIEGLLITFVK